MASIPGAKERFAWGAAIGALATAGLSGWLFLAHAWLRLPFVPFDITDAIIRVTPGSIATAGIEALGEGAKRLLMVFGVALMLGAGAGLGALAAWLVPRDQRPEQPAAWGRSVGRQMWRVAILVAAALAATVAVESIIAWNQAPIARSVAGLAVSYAIWAWAVSAGVAAAAGSSSTTASKRTDGAASRDGAEGQPAIGRRGFLLRFAAASLGTALAGASAGQLAAGLNGDNAAVPRSLPTPPAPGELVSEITGAAPAANGSPTAAALTEQPRTANAGAVPETAGGAGTPMATAEASATPAATPTLAPAGTPPPGTPLAAFVPAPGTRPNLTSLPDFYVVNIATRDPIGDVKAWRLTVRGLVDHPLALTYEDLLRLPRVDVYVTLECISNPLAGRLISTAQFNGARLADVLAQAGVQPGAAEVVTRSLDGYSESLPLDKALDRGTLLVYGMDGLTLEQRHGYPLRLYNPNHYGMKNPKWLQALELVPDPFTGYWEARGWDQEAVVKTTSVLDTRGALAPDGGAVTLGGVAFAGWRGIQSVLVNIDNTAWRAATLDSPLSPYTWVRWRYDWRDAARGPHDVVVRAIDGAGEEQTNFITPPHPDGASGWHKVHVVVS